MAGRNLTLGQRREIEWMNAEGIRPCEIAQAVGVTTATIYRELKRGDTGKLNRFYRPAYDAEAAERNAQACIRQRGRKKRRDRSEVVG